MKTFLGEHRCLHEKTDVTFPHFILCFPSGVSHSATADMQTIEQETPVTAKPRRKHIEDGDEPCFTSSSR